MPRASINVEFEDGELRKFGEDMLRRWTLNTIHDLLKHLRDPHLLQLIREALSRGVDIGTRVGSRRGPSPYEEDMRGGPPSHQRPDGDRSPFQGPGMAEEILRGSPGASGPKRCMPVEANLYQEEGWSCHKCSTYNGVQRLACRQCAHERCDEAQSPPGDPSVPSGSA